MYFCNFIAHGIKSLSSYAITSITYWSHMNMLMCLSFFGVENYTNRNTECHHTFYINQYE